MPRLLNWVDTSSGFGKLCGWLCLIALIALASEMVDPSYLDPSHQKFIFLIGALGMWRYGNAATHYLRGMYFLHWRFPRMRKAVERMGSPVRMTGFVLCPARIRKGNCGCEYFLFA